MPVKIDRSVREEQLNALPNMRFVQWADQYQNKDSKAVMRCSCGHGWEASVGKLLNKGTGCPKCAGNHRYSKIEREEQLNALPNMRFVRWLETYRNQKSKAVMCCDGGHEWAARVYSLLQNSGCPKCAKVHRYSGVEREIQLDALQNMRFVKWADGEYQNSHSKAVMCCDEGHEWCASVDSLIRGHGCPACVGLHRYSAKEREEQLDVLPSKFFVRWECGYQNCYSKAVMKCEHGHEWSASVSNLLKNRGCPACANSGYDPTKSGTIYALLHEDGSCIKIGISNVYKQRLSRLRYATPFNFVPVHTYHSDDGYAIRDLEKTIHSQFESAGLVGFDGATEWLKFDPYILTVLRMLGA